jgi:tripartite-type tricarboxylate transporter receptor subunit TctC
MTLHIALHGKNYGNSYAIKLLTMPLIAGALIGGPVAAADAYPSKLVKILVNYPPGGPLDAVARLVGNRLQATLKQPVVVENSSGGGGNVGAASVARAPADGYTVLFSIDAPFTMNPALYSSMPFKPNDLKPVTMVGYAGTTIAVNASTGFNSLKELIAKAKQESLTFSSAGNGSPGHIAAAMLTKAAGIKEVTHVPYRGNAPAVMAVVSGEVQAGILATAGWLPHITSKKVIPLAVAASQRSILLPTIPTTKELGFPEVELEFSMVAMVPSQTPDPIVTRLHKEIAAAIAQPDVQERMKGMDIVPANLTPAETAERLAKASERYTKVIRTTGIKAE